MICGRWIVSACEGQSHTTSIACYSVKFASLSTSLTLITSSLMEMTTTIDGSFFHYFFHYFSLRPSHSTHSSILSLFYSGLIAQA